MSVAGFLNNIASSALAKLQTAFTPKAPPPTPALRGSASANSKRLRFWWRNPSSGTPRIVTPHMRHKFANDKGLMVAENPLLRGLIARHFKEVA